MSVSINGVTFWLLGAVLAFLTGCDSKLPPPGTIVLPTGSSAAAVGFTNHSYEIINVWPHDTNAFTEGLVYHDGTLFESTGSDGHSTLRKVDLKTGRVLKQAEVPEKRFAEGLAVLGGKAFQLTYLAHKGFVYELETFQLEKEFVYPGDGWGLATDGQWLILSDGTDRIRFFDPLTFKAKRTIRVHWQDRRVGWLNELEYIKGEIFANIWHTDYVVRIDPATGVVLGTINFAGLLEAQDRSPDTDVLNGIAYDAVGDRLFVTGKRWPKLFEVRLKTE